MSLKGKLTGQWIIILVIFIFVSIDNSFAEESTTVNKYTITTSTDPIELFPNTLGFGHTLMTVDYNLDFEVDKPNSMNLGDFEDVWIFPKNGELVVTFNVDGIQLPPITRDLEIGDEETISVPTHYFGIPNIVEIFVKPTASAFPSVTEPGILSHDMIQWDSIRGEKLRIGTEQDNINSDFDISLDIPIVINLHVGAKIDYVLDKMTIIDKRFQLSANPNISNSIKIIAPKSSMCGEGTVLKDGLCVSIEKENGGGCLIATATFGSELSLQVQQLRELRDNTILKTNSGIAFMSMFNQFYYSFSPTVADLERESPTLREVMKVTLTPMLSSLSLLNHVDIDSDEEMLGYGISLILLNIGMYVGIPIFGILVIRKI